MDPYGFLSVPWYALAGALMLAHLWYDFHVQGPYISTGKRTSNLLLTVHALTWTLCVSVPLYAVGFLTIEQFQFLFITHWLMDWTKCHALPEKKQWPLVLDQLVHIATLGLCLWRW